ncbi:MAG: hypothetical protein AAGD11_01100 [Planctomycetota bacterium]
MNFSEPHKVYSAESNVEAHLIVNMLSANGIEALADEDRSGVNFWFGGQVGQYFLPNIWVEKSNSLQAAQLINAFEQQKREQVAVEKAKQDEDDLSVECEDCGKSIQFPAALEGTTQVCKHCGAYVDVGELDWDVDVGEPEE